MSRTLLRSTAFARMLRRALRKQPDNAATIQETLERLSEDVFNPLLRSHKLKGKLQGSWACSAGYDLRIIFSLVQYKGAEAILLEAIGTHDEVY